MKSEPSGRGTLRLLLGGNVLWLSVVSFLNDAASEMIYPLLPMFLVGTLGAGPAFLGLIEGIAESASSFFKLLSGWLSDRFRRRKPLVLAGYAIAAGVRPVIAIVTAPWHVLAVRFSDRLGKGFRTAPRDALLAAAVPAGLRGRAFGFHRAADHAGAVLGPILASVLLLVFGGALRPVFALAIVPGVLTVLVVVFRVREEPSPAPAVEPSAEGAGDTVAESRLRDLGPGFVRYLLVLVVFTLGNATDAFLLLRASELGVATAAVPLLWAVHHVSKMIWSVPGGALADRIGARPAIITGWAVYALVYAGFAVAGTAWQVWALFIGYGLFYGLTESPEKALVATLAPSHLRGSAYGAYHAAIGVSALPASIIFGVLWQRFGAVTAFGFGAGLALIASVLLALLVRPADFHRERSIPS